MSPSQTTLGGLPSPSGCLLCPGASVASSSSLCVSTLQSSEHRLGWDSWHVTAELSVPDFNASQMAQCLYRLVWVPGCSGDALGCYSLSDQNSVLPFPPSSKLQTLLLWIWQ